MVYKTYIKRNGKKFGPYYYETYRDENGKVRSRYVKNPSKKSKPKRKSKKLNLSNIFLIIILLFFAGLLISFAVAPHQTIEKASLTGNFISDISGNIFINISCRTWFFVIYLNYIN